MQYGSDINSVYSLLRPAIFVDGNTNSCTSVLQQNQEGATSVDRPKRCCTCQFGITNACIEVRSCTNAETKLARATDRGAALHLCGSDRR